MCRCDPDLVAWLENDFKTTLQNQATLEQWAQWLESVVDRTMKPYETGPTQEFARAARQFLLKWSFYRYDTEMFKFTLVPSPLQTCFCFRKCYVLVLNIILNCHSVI